VRSIRKREMTKAQNSELKEREREMSVSSFSGFQALVAKSKINPREASGALSSRTVCTRLVKYGEK